MGEIRYRRGKAFAARMADCAEREDPKEDSRHQQLRRRLFRAMQEELTPRQREVLILYYGAELNMREIAERLGVDRSTVSRTIQRGEGRLKRCLRYGAAALLDGEG